MDANISRQNIFYENLTSVPGEQALFATSPSWLDTPYKITEDFRYVMYTGDYFPIPFTDFKSSLGKLVSKSVVLHSFHLKESIDFDPSSREDFVYLLSDFVFCRFRKDYHKSSSNPEVLHTLKMVGKKESLSDLCFSIGLPNPFEPEKYPYKNLFKDVSNSPPIKVLR